MREIKFRGRRIDNGEWVYGDLLTIRNKASFDSAIVFFDGCVLPKAESVSKETVGQYTGLKDKNGVEIYEGDIVYMVANGVTGPRVIEFLNGAFGVRTVKSSTDIWWAEVWHMDVKVIGNIYENPELLEVTT